jgi:hypothetical protein
VIKWLVYLVSICLTIGLFVALWATDGFRSVVASQNKPLMVFAAGVLCLAVSLGPLLLTNRFTLCLAERSNLELWARGSIAGLMITILWACLYMVQFLLQDEPWNCRPWLLGVGFTAAVGLGAIGLLERSFLRENLVAIGLLLALAGGAIFPKYHLSGQALAAAGIALILTTTLVTGRIRLFCRQFPSYEVSREENPFQFWLVIVLLGASLGFTLIGPL